MTDTAAPLVDSAWFVIATRPRQEAVAQLNLERQGYNAVLPQLTLKKRRQNKWTTVTEPLFPGYVFVQLAFGTDDPAPIRSTQGCRDLVRFGEHYPPVPAALMTQLLSQASGTLDGGPVFSAGETVRIEEGPFAGLSAIFGMAKGDDRAQVLIEMLGKVQRVVLTIDSLSKT